MNDDHDYAGLIGRAAGAADVAALLAAHGPWDVKAYPAVGKHPTSEYRNAKPHGVQLCFEAQVCARAQTQTHMAFNARKGNFWVVISPRERVA